MQILQHGVQIIMRDLCMQATLSQLINTEKNIRLRLVPTSKEMIGTLPIYRQMEVLRIM